MKQTGTLTEIVAAMSLAMDLEEDVKLYHAWRVALLGQAMAEVMAPAVTGQVFLAGLMHDVGAIGLPDHVIHYPTLDEQKEIPQVVAHCFLGGKIVGGLPGFTRAKEFIEDHHEWWDGSGYPKGKRGPDISLGGQILRLADAVDLWLRGNKDMSRTELVAKAAKRINREYNIEVFQAFKQVVSQGIFFHRVTRENSLAFYMRQVESKLASELDRVDFSLEQVLTVFAQVIDTKHQYTKGHSERVAQYSKLLAQAVGLDQKQQQKAMWAGLLHDVGKLAVPRKVLDKPGKLERNEIDLIRLHPVLTMEILQMVAVFEDLVSIAGYHHERYDGSGYPDGLAGEEIPQLARVLAVADAFDAMTSGRSYQQTKSLSEAVAIIEKNSGSQFDPEVASVAGILNNPTLAKEIIK
jgi:putative nucleotidyltransferase with HDIG domain